MLGPAFFDAFPGAIAQHPPVAPAVVSRASTRSARRSSTACKVTGATVHIVTPELDAGPIVMQAAVPVEDDDTVETLRRASSSRSIGSIPAAIQRILDGGWRIEGRRVVFDPAAAAKPGFAIS